MAQQLEHSCKLERLQCQILATTLITGLELKKVHRSLKQKQNNSTQSGTQRKTLLPDITSQQEQASREESKEPFRKVKWLEATPSCQFKTHICRGQVEDTNRDWEVGQVRLCSPGLLYSRGAISFAPLLGDPRKNFASSSTTGPEVSAYKGLDTGLIIMHMENISACYQRKEHRLMEEEEALGSLCTHGCTVSYRAHYHSSLLGTRPGEHCSQQSEEEETLSSRNRHDLTKHQWDSYDQSST